MASQVNEQVMGMTPMQMMQQIMMKINNYCETTERIARELDSWTEELKKGRANRNKPVSNESIQRIDDTAKEMIGKPDIRERNFEEEDANDIRQQREEEKKEGEEMIEQIEDRSDKTVYQVKENVHAIADDDKKTEERADKIVYYADEDGHAIADTYKDAEQVYIQVHEKFYEPRRNPETWSQKNDNSQRNQYGKEKKRRYSYDDTSNKYQNRKYHHNKNGNHERKWSCNDKTHTNNTYKQKHKNNQCQKRSRSYSNNEYGKRQRSDTNTLTQVSQNNDYHAPETNNSGRHDFH